ncbi:Membrane protein involved in the export of O-antigen and teichoic acid [Colwellia chukchiensis]|uniref:Membrane protein involved in the export of O-antigen and teichoic acid n=1 Tax=Colwellia chukchiensis TaxID=641665 RepID=A0A1H7SGE0_9GAMM|nr:lipopolysaccharide biosynthesis protein [Colwellia chukchiensis]SEL70754.1 Membrane protein involved in the export of O-antigen and teichoic acid [Colwellia chukchiensis]
MTNSNQLKSQVLHSLKWVALGKVLTQIIRWAMTFWVIRLLLPEDYGVVAMADMFAGFLALFIGGLFAPAIIQTKELSQTMLKQMFGLIIVVYSTMFLVQYNLASVVGNFYQSEHVTSILKVTACLFIVKAIAIIPTSLLARNMAFKHVSIISSVANITAAVTTLVLAYLQFGFWAIIIGEIIAVTLRAVLTLAVQPITFLPEFKFTQVKPHLKFGGLIMLHSIVFYVFLHMDVAIAGRLMSVTEIGVFAIALQFALMPQKKILPLLKEVAFPAFSKIQDQPQRINAYILKAQKMSILLTIPIFWGLASVIDQIIPIILGDKWLEAIYPTMIILFVMPLRFSEELFNPALKSQRKVKHMLHNVSIMSVVMLISIVLAAPYGAVGLAAAWACGFPIAYGVVACRNANLLNIKYRNIAKLFLAPVAAGIIMLIVVFTLKQYTGEIAVLNLLIQIAAGGVAFISALYLFDKKLIVELISIFKRSPKRHD